MREGWTETTLGDVAEYINGYPFKPSDLGEIGTAVIRIKQLLEPSEKVDRTIVKVPERCVLRDGDIVFSWSGTLAVRVWNRGPAYLNQHLFRVVEKPGVNHDWLPLVIDHAIEELLEKSHGTTMKHITKQTLLPHQVLLPPLAEQKRIVDVVSSVDAYIDALQQQVDAARAARKAVLHELLTDGGDDWTETTLGEVSVITYGYTESASTEVVGPKFLRITDIQDAGVNWDLVPYCPIDDKQLVKQRLLDGDIVFARTGATTGKSFLVQSPPESVCASYLIRLRPDARIVLPYFLNLNFQTDNYWIEIRSGISGSAQGGFNASKLSALSVQVPPIAEQGRIVEIVSSMDDVLQAAERAVVEAKNLRSGLLSDLLSGEHEIPVSYDELLGAA